MALLTMRRVTKTFRRGRATVAAVSQVSLDLQAGQTLGVIGESGAGKSTLGRIAIGLLAPDSGDVGFDGADLATMSRQEMRKFRSEIQIVFQEPYQALDPRMRIIDIVQEPLEIHSPELSRAERRRRAHEALDRVSLAENLRECRPAQLSGGEQQRTGIARAIVTRPRLVLLDEPTSSLDLSLRAGILQLLIDLQRERDIAYLLVSHDMTTIEYVSHRIAVMYRGRLVEEGPTEVVTGAPAHPYTRLLMESRLSADPRQRGTIRESVAPRMPVGNASCIFYRACPVAALECGTVDVQLADLGDEHKVACILVAPTAASLPGEEPGGTIEKGASL